ncbi:S1 RNA-binding domain-containing protein [Candidatus Laterigemmans baculatus]|uniref:S1 RNA-binding domain-containing protein n=1 Tax=Candidatus Laterigemmans baculatus TaxID=2770505 RepID=UPI0013DBA698|nr:S1 RNA-binding domain-containing protein [Candidatus Laterigemmans baculatus]
MTVDLEAIARRQRCEASVLRTALPLLEQGYEPPFLTRYRRDELGSVPERALWEVVSALRTDRQLEERREELRAKYRDGNLDDDALLASIAHAQTPRQLDRIARRIRSESGNTHPASRLAVRLLNPKPNDPVELSELAELVVGAADATAAVEGLDSVLGQYLAADSRMVQAASRWMDKHIQLHVIEVHDPHEGNAEAASDSDDSDDEAVAEDQPNKAPSSARSGASSPAAETPQAETPQAESPQSESPEADSGEGEAAPPEASQAVAPQADSPQADSPAAQDATAEASETPAADAPASEAPAADAPAADAPAADAPAAEPPASKTAKGLAGGREAGGAKAKKKEPQRKKISPRQRRRRWLVSVLQPLAGKSLPKARLTAFQVVMLGRALRSQVARCEFRYDAAELVDVLSKTAAGFNAGASNELSQVVVDNEAAIREALEGAWWDDLIDRAARRLISVAADSLRRQMHREPIDARNVLVVDAVGPRTAAVAIVGPDDGVLHTEDIPCQLTKAVRQQMVTRLGELVHQFHVDLIVLSNGPARRGCMVALTELLTQSETGSLRWTLADRAGAETYAGGPEGNRELRSTPRRFRAAVWLSQLVRSPARALAKVDPSKLRLGSYQRELADKPLAGALQDVVTSGVSQISVDANAADRGWLASLPGVTDAVAEAIDRHRRQTLYTSREELLTLDAWPDVVASRQAAGFLRVFGGSQPLDATAIHPDDYALAEKLMARLEIPAPPSAPPGYEPPNFSVEETKTLAPEPDSGGLKFTEVKIAQADPDAPFGETLQGEAAAKEASADASATAEEATASEPAAEEPAAEPPATEEATAGEATAGEATAEEAAAEEAAAEVSAAEDSAAEEPAAEEPAAEKAGAEGEASSEPAKASVEPYRHPMPEAEKVSRCIKEWQVGEHRVKHIVRSLCEPFRDLESTETSPAAALVTVPKLSELKPGDQVIGVVVGVAGFGVFVELGPECSGLIHVSRISEDFVEDLNEYVQIGDVVTAWVTEIDSKRRRVALSGISPERQAVLRQQRQDRPPRGGSRGPGGKPGAKGKGAAARGGGKGGAPASGGGRPERAAGGREARGGAATGRGGGRGGQGSGGQGRSGGPGRSGGGRESRGSRGPTTYTTVARSDKPAEPLSDAMRTGEEPLRSFGDLMQFFKTSREEPADTPKQAKEAKKPKQAKETEPAKDSETAKPVEPQAATEGGGEAPAAGAEAPQAAVSPANKSPADQSPADQSSAANSPAPNPAAANGQSEGDANRSAGDGAASPPASEEGAASGTDRSS